MEEKNFKDIIPSQEKGFIITAESSVELKTSEAAKTLFIIAKGRLLDVNNWHEIAGDLLAHFQLTDDTGMHVPGPARKGLYFKIDIPGPGSKEGEGFDWVEVEEMDKFSSEDSEGVALRVRPAPNPSKEGGETAHFYSSESTSTFTVSRENNKVTAAIFDRNTKANPEANNIADKIRNSLVGAVGIVSFSKLQWKSLTNGLLVY